MHFHPIQQLCHSSANLMWHTLSKGNVVKMHYTNCDCKISIEYIKWYARASCWCGNILWCDIRKSTTHEYRSAIVKNSKLHTQHGIRKWLDIASVCVRLKCDVESKKKLVRWTVTGNPRCQIILLAHIWSLVDCPFSLASLFSVLLCRWVSLCHLYRPILLYAFLPMNVHWIHRHRHTNKPTICFGSLRNRLNGAARSPLV